MDRRPFKNLLVGVIAAVTLLSLPPTAAADHSELKVVRPETGPPLLTHGHDPVPPDADAQPSLRRGSQLGFAPGSVERNPVCAGDYYLQFIYAYPAGRNRYGKMVGRIRGAVRRMNAVLNADSIASGGGSADFKVGCTPHGEISVWTLETSGKSFSRVVSDAREAGIVSDRADFAIFFDGGTDNACGTASYTDDERLTLENEANSGGDYAVIWSRCWDTDIPMHEVGHMMGAVQYGAPNSTGTGGHCIDERDVMCYSPDGGDRNQGRTREVCSGRPRFDCNFDDYFDSAPERGEYLASHWNLGSPLNRMIAFSARPNLIESAVRAVTNLLGGRERKGANRTTAAAPGSWRLHKIQASGTVRRLTVKVRKAQTNALTLYVRRGKAPSARAFRCRARVRKGAARCTIREPRRGLWYAGVRSGRDAAGKPYSIKAKIRR